MKNNMSEINKKHKLFGDDVAERVTTDEMNTIFNEIRKQLGPKFSKISLTTPLSEKTTHGDVDIVYVTSIVNPRVEIVNALEAHVINTHKNGEVFSVLYKSDIGKLVHVDFIECEDEDSFATKLQYFSYNDFSGIVGMLSKKLHFKYGSDGFFKRFRDRKGNWHDILISKNLMNGLKILGWNPLKFNSIKIVDDISTFILSSPMFDSKYVYPSELNQSDKKSYKRPVIKHVVDELRLANKSATITDEDYFFKKYFQNKYEDVEKIKSEINSSIPVKSKYNGVWLMSTFPELSSGKIIGDILKYLSDTFGENLDNEDEDSVYGVVYKYLKNHSKDERNM